MKLISFQLIISVLLLPDMAEGQSPMPPVTCPPPPPLAYPPPECEWHFDFDANGCPINYQLRCTSVNSTPPPSTTHIVPTLPTHSPSKCPPGVMTAVCIANPCRAARCPGVPGATCVAEYCGGCQAKWYKNGHVVTDECNQQHCDANEEYQQCGTACPARCGPINYMCVKRCVAGCFCTGNLVRGPDGKCIPRDRCPNSEPNCPPLPPLAAPPSGCHWNYTKDTKGCPTNYHLTCQNGCPPGVGTVNCLQDPCTNAKCSHVPGATCRADYCGGCQARWFVQSRDVTGECKYSQTCGHNEHYSNCGSYCEPQCGPLLGRPCAALCKPGCFCDQGLVRGPDGKCIAQNQCPQQSAGNPGSGKITCANILCIENSHCFEDEKGPRCISNDGSEPSCENHNCPHGQICILGANGPYCGGPTRPKCDALRCQEGFICEERLNGGYCIPLGGGNGCTVVSCQAGLRCIELASGPKCIPEREQPKSGDCPTPTGIGSCIVECSDDSACPDSQKCCSNGCGRSCRLPIIPSRPNPLG